MNNINRSILEKTQQHVTSLLAHELDKEIVYHTVKHAKYVAEAARKIGQESKLNDTELILVQVAAWFHDVGYIISAANHEYESAQIASAFLKENNIEPDQVKIVNEAILSTKIPQNPKSSIAKALCDADMYHLSVPDYYDHIELMRKEINFLKNTKTKKREFDKHSIMFFDNHNYHTEYGKTVLQKGKDNNLQMIKKNLEKNSEKNEKSEKELNKEIKKLKKKLDKQKGYSRGVESMFRLTARNQINLSSIADNKSNILISVNTIIISIVLSVLVSRFDEYPSIILPSIIFLVVSLITIIFAILSTRPHVSSGRFTREDLSKRKVNLLFFGNFYNMEFEDYDDALGEMMKDDTYLYSTMIQDQYSLGKVLAQKYKLLRKAYNFFMYGLIITVIAYVLSFLNI